MKKVYRKIYLFVMSIIDMLKLTEDIEDNWHTDND